MDGLAEAFAAALAAAGDAVLAGITAFLTQNAPALLASGLVAFLSALGTWLYQSVGVLLAGINVVTQRPEAWTNRLDVVVAGWQGARVLASAFLVCLLAAHVVEWARSDGAAADKLADALGDMALAAALVQVSLELVGLAMPAYNALLTWAADGAGAATLPGWRAAGELSAEQAGGYEGLARLVLAVQVAWAFGHAVVGTAWWDVLLVCMPLAIAAAGWWYTRAWFGKWGMAVAASLIAQFALCLAARLGTRMLARAAETLGGASLPEDVSRAAVYLLLGIGFTALVVKLAGQMHSGVSVLHPFSAAGRAGRALVPAASGVGGGVRGVFVGSAVAAGGPGAVAATSTAAHVTQSANPVAGAPGSPTPIAPA
jgi:hypothetical protein